MKPAILIAIVTATQLLMQAAPQARKTAAGKPGAAKATAAIPSPKSLKIPPLRAVQTPEPMQFTLANGMRVFLLENHELPLVNGVALVRSGNLFDPADKRGLADLTGQVMRSGGTKSKTGDELDEALENMAASVESSIGETQGRVSFSGLKENSDAILAIFKDVLVNPEFRQDKLDLAKTQSKSGISRRNDDAGSVANREFANTVYGRDNAYGWMIEYEHVDRIQRADLIAFYQRYFFPKNVILGVYGDFDANAMKSKLEQLFADWKVEQPAVPPFAEVKKSSTPGIFLAERDDVTQTFFEMGHLGGMNRDKDYPALSVAASILGSGFSSRLMSEVRTKLGYAYSIGAGWGAQYGHQGLFRISGSTKSATTAETIRVIREEVEKLRKAEVSEEELRISKDRILNGFVFNFDSPVKSLNRLMTYEYFGYPRDFIKQYQAGIDSTTRADILRVAKQYFKPEEFAIVAVGNPKEFGKPLDSLGIPVTKLDLTIPEPKQEKAQASDSTLAKGKEILAKAQAAVGGAAELAAIKDLDSSRTVDMEMGGAKMKATQRTMAVLPDQFRQEQEFPFGKVQVYSDGKTGWLKTPQGEMPMQTAILQQVRGEMFRMLPTLLLSDADAARTVNAVSDNAVEIADKQGNQVRLVVDPSTNLPAQVIYMSPGMGGAPSEVVESLTDWRDAGGGIKLPFRVAIEQAGKKIFDSTTTELKLNSGLKVEELSKKP